MKVSSMNKKIKMFFFFFKFQVMDKKNQGPLSIPANASTSPYCPGPTAAGIEPPN
jgi:hypothetical protein